jgi:FtsP/CotA-like multicopper oxidase with cupredoxin domain
MDPQADHSRRSFLRRGAVLGAAAALGPILSSCSPNQPRPATSTPVPPEDTTTMPNTSRVLLAYFSRAGENYY